MSATDEKSPVSNVEEEVQRVQAGIDGIVRHMEMAEEEKAARKERYEQWASVEKSGDKIAADFARVEGMAENDSDLMQVNNAILRQYGEWHRQIKVTLPERKKILQIQMVRFQKRLWETVLKNDVDVSEPDSMKIVLQTVVTKFGEMITVLDTLNESVADLTTKIDDVTTRLDIVSGRVDKLCGDKFYDKKNYKQALYWYHKSANQGDADAQNSLGYLHEHEQGVEQDLKQAFHWYRKSADQGNAKGQNNLGACYQFAKGVDKDLKQAVYWYRKSADQGNAKGQNELGFCYQKRIGLDEDLKQAVYWYRKSSAQGHAPGQNNLGYCFQHGIGVTQDLKQAVHWFQKAADQSNAVGQCNVGYCYYNGQGVAKDLEQGAKWYLESAKQGNGTGQNNIGVCYQHGQGVEKDLKQAVYWFQKAADQGNTSARAELEKAWARKVLEQAKRKVCVVEGGKETSGGVL